MLYKYNSKELIFEKVSLKSYLLGLFAIVFVFSGFSFTAAVDFNNAVERIPVLLKAKQDELNEENLKAFIDQMHLQNKDIVFAQAMLESGNFKSAICKNNNNLFGMKVAASRPTTAIAEENNHAVYKDWQNSVIDYAMWQSSYARNLTKEQYLQLLGEMYAEDTNYVNALKNLIK